MAGSDRTVGPVHDLRWVLVGLVVATSSVVLVQAGCNVGPQRTIADGRLRVELREYEITPRNLRMSAGPLRIDAHNAGRMVHSLRIINDADKRGGRRVRFAVSSGAPLRPGETRELIDTCLGPGEYRIIGGQAGDEDLGMVADLRVDGPAPSCKPATGDQPVEDVQQAGEGD